MIPSALPNTLLGNPGITFLATDEVIGNLFGGFSAGDSNPIPPSVLVIDEDMRTRTLNSRLSFESHSMPAGRVPNLSTHPYFAAALTALSNWLEGQIALRRPRTSRLVACSDSSVAGGHCRPPLRLKPVMILLAPVGMDRAWLTEFSR